MGVYEDICKDFLPYRDPNGLNQNDLLPDGTPDISGNGIRYEGERTLSIVRNNLFIPLDERSRLISALQKYEVATGTIQRTVDNRYGYESFDDTIARLTLGYFLTDGFPKRFLEHSEERVRKHDSVNLDNTALKILLSRALFYGMGGPIIGVKGVFNNINPGTFYVKSWLVRPNAAVSSLMAHAQFCNWEMPSPARRLAWCAAMMDGAESSASDSKVLSWMCIVVADRVIPKDSDCICRHAISYWKSKMSEIEGGVGSFIGKQRPAGKWLWGEKGDLI